jgi:hypothetical protein
MIWLTISEISGFHGGEYGVIALYTLIEVNRRFRDTYCYQYHHYHHYYHNCYCCYYYCLYYYYYYYYYYYHSAVTATVILLNTFKVETLLAK